jgi:hypothetical protein
MKVSLTPEEFANFTACFLLDQVRNKEEMLPGNEQWQDFTETLQRKGLSPVLLQYYTRLKGLERLAYKRISPVFKTDTNRLYVVNILGNPDLLTTVEPEKRSIIKDIAKKAMRLITQEKKRTGFLLNEEKVDRILDHVINEYYGEESQ